MSRINWHPVSSRDSYSYRQFEPGDLSTIESLSVDTSSRAERSSSFHPHPLSDSRQPQWIEGFRNDRASSYLSAFDEIGPQIQDPNRLLESTTQFSSNEMQRSQINMKSRLPKWMWNLVLLGLGIGPRVNNKRILVATMLHVSTVFAGILFGATGLFFNVFDTLSNYTNTTMVILVTKSVLGLSWICLGVYANALAARLFANPRMADSIRLHSKTFMKISTVLIVSVLFTCVLVANLYDSVYLLDDQPVNDTDTNYPNCVTIGVSVVLCHMYFYSKILYSIFCLTWNLLCAAIFLSVCRTHTIGIRRFMKELIYDSMIYEEFFVLKSMNRNNYHEENNSVTASQRDQGYSESFSVWDDDITGWDDCDDPLPNNASVLKTLRIMRQAGNNYDRTMTFRERYLATYNIATGRDRKEETAQQQRVPPSHSPPRSRTPTTVQTEPEENETENKDGHHLDQTDENNSNLPNENITTAQENITTAQENSSAAQESSSAAQENSSAAQENSSAAQEKWRNDFDYPRSRKRTFGSASQYGGVSSSGEMRPPIMRNEDLMFTYFMLLRRLCSTSRILQRWLSSWITFVMMWCGFLIISWMKHSAHLMSIAQFLLPLMGLGLLTSAYAEVNFEGERLLKFVLPTTDRMPVIYYFQNTRLELKIFSFTMSYNAILTVVAGIAITFATRIILDQFELL